MTNPDSITRSVAGDAAAASPAASRVEPTRSTGSLALTQTVVAPASNNLARVQAIIVGAMVLVAVLAILRLWMVEGLLSAARVDGPSMAPALRGGHYRVTCEDCRFVFACDAEHAPRDRLAVCPNCGYSSSPLQDARLTPGERVLIDRWPLLFRAPRRGDVVAAGDPTAPGEFVVKRVAGRPGQQLAIQAGDLLADRQLVRKSLRELVAERILVHDNNYQPRLTSGVPDRWQSRTPGSGWHVAMTGYRHESPASDQRLDWLQYYHWRMYAQRSRTTPSPVLDSDCYNQAVNREQNAVPDVLLSCRLRARGSGKFGLAASDGEQRFEAIFDLAAKSVVLTAGGSEVARKPLPLDFAHRAVALDWGLCDRQVLLSIASREVFRHEYERPAAPPTEALHPLAIGAAGVTLEVTELRVWRDLYYLEPAGTGGDWQAAGPLPVGAFALFGDNTTVSTDSRQWEAGVTRSQIRGRVYRPFWSASH